MAIPPYERTESRTFDQNWLNQTSGTVTYVVTLDSVNNDATTSPLNAVPQPGGSGGISSQFHPSDLLANQPYAGCRLESNSLGKQLDSSGKVWEVIAHYTNFHNYSITPGQYSKELTFALTTVDIPYAVLVPYQYPSDNVVPQLAYKYDIRFLKRERRTLIKTIKTWVANGQYTITSEQNIANQIGKYHWFSNYAPVYPASIPWKFHGAQVSHLNGAVYQLIYTWSLEENLVITDPTKAPGYTAPTYGTQDSPAIVFPPAIDSTNTISLFAWTKFVILPGPPVYDSNIDTGTLYAGPPKFLTVPMFDAATDFLTIYQANLPGAPQNGYA